jgi:hypothetical protein
MANQEQLNLLKKDIKAWNQFRQDNETMEIDLTEANLSKADLSGADLSLANLWRADLRGAALKGADFRDAYLSGTSLGEANLRGANFKGANLERVNLEGANLDGAEIGATTFSNIVLFNKAIGLEKVKHSFPSFIDTHTLQSFNGQIPESFLRGCGLGDVEIESARLADPTLTNEEINKIIYRIYDLRATRAIQVSPLFISYSHADTPFVDHLDSALVEKGIRFWRDIQDATAGRLETQIDRAIRQNPTVLLILSKNSLNSDWVQHEVRTARSLEKELGRDVLCPVALDDSWKSAPWPARILEQIMEYNILDFSGWESAPVFESKFSKLLSGLDLFYKKPQI